MIVCMYMLLCHSHNMLLFVASAPIKDDASVDTASTIYTEEIVTYYHPVHRTYHGLLIGKGGSTLKRMKLETGSRIDIMNGKDSVMIKGTQDKVDHAIKVIDDFLQQV